MFIYSGCTCAVCGEIFDKTSDVVVCPDCGTPSHRHCWKELGHCVNETKHSADFAWKAPEKVHTQGMVSCPKCQTDNPMDAAYCEGCGIALSQKQGAVIPSFTDIKAPQGLSVQNSALSDVVLPKALEGEQDGVKYKDMAIYIGTSSPYYIFKFKRMAKDGKSYNPFCWSAFLFGPMYFLYRKMWLLGILCGLGNLIINTPNAILFAVQTGVLPASSPLMFAGITGVASILSVVLFVTNLLWGFLAIPLFKKKVIKDLCNIKSIFPNNADYYNAIANKSGPSKVVLLCSLIFTLYYMMF